MNLAALKKVRVVISLLFFISIALIFLDFRNLIPVNIINYLMFLQFVPSAIKFLGTLSIAVFGFAVVLLLTVLFGRVYCSTICPFGTFQDILIFVSKKFRIKKFFRFTKEQKILRYSILALTLALIPFAGLFLINLLDPYSNFGRIFTGLFKPVVIGGNNLVSSTLEYFKNYSLYPIEQKGISIIALIFPVFMLVLVSWLSVKKGRLYCNSVCPVGTLLGFLSKYAIFRIVIDKNNCNGCGKCELACKSSCINKKTHEVDFSRCVGCMNCLASCPSEGIIYEFAYKSKPKMKEIEADFNKRSFIVSTSVYVLGIMGLANAQYKIESKKESKMALYRKNPITPPGSKGIKHFTSNCTACHLCVSACPTKVLQPSFLEYGFTGMMQPRMENAKGYCNLKCNICSTVCPSGAIQPIGLEEKEKTQLGVAIFVHENCIVYTENTDCGACSEHCPTKAVNMVPYNKLFIPKVTEEYCIGCGACEYACPTKPFKAIYIEGNTIHKIAKKNVEKKVEPEKAPAVKTEKKQEKKVEKEEDFPF